MPSLMYMHFWYAMHRHLWWCLVGAIIIVQCIFGALFLGLGCNLFLVFRFWCYALSAISRRLATAVAHLLYILVMLMLEWLLQEDLASKLLVETLSPLRAPSLGQKQKASPSSGSALTAPSGALDLSSSSFTANLATVKREVSGAEDKKFGQVQKVNWC